MQQIIDNIKKHLDSGKLEFTQLADGSGVLLDIENRKVLTLNNSAVLLFTAIQQHNDVSIEQLLAQLKVLVNQGDQVSDEDLMQDLDEFLSEFLGVLS